MVRRSYQAYPRVMFYDRVHRGPTCFTVGVGFRNDTFGKGVFWVPKGETSGIDFDPRIGLAVIPIKKGEILAFNVDYCQYPNIPKHPGFWHFALWFLHPPRP